MKVFVVFALIIATSYAAEEPAKAAAAADKKDDRAKTFQRLIPADVLRGN